MPWGEYGGAPPCEHLRELRALLERIPVHIYSENGEQPPGWVNVQCIPCERVYETVLQPPWEDDPDADVYTTADEEDAETGSP